MCSCRDRPNVSALRSSVQPAPRDTLGLAVPRPGHVEAKRPDQPDEHLSLQKATRRADVMTALLLVALTGFCGGRFPMEAL